MGAEVDERAADEGTNVAGCVTEGASKVAPYTSDLSTRRAAAVASPSPHSCHTPPPRPQLVDEVGPARNSETEIANRALADEP